MGNSRRRLGLRLRLDLYIFVGNGNAVLGFLRLGLRLGLGDAFGIVGDNVLRFVHMRNRQRRGADQRGVDCIASVLAPVDALVGRD